MTAAINVKHTHDLVFIEAEQCVHLQNFICNCYFKEFKSFKSSFAQNIYSNIMSQSNASYWKSLNEMLRNDKIEFTPLLPAANLNPMLLSKLTIKNSDVLKKAVQYALDNPNEIANLEYEHNNGQPIKITENHLDRARQFIENGIASSSLVLNVGGDIPLDGFLLECYTMAQQALPEYCIVTDNRRKVLISTIFGATEFQEEISERSENVTHNKIACTQVICESADVASAIDQLIINLSDRTRSSWRIQSVYVQESLKNRINDMLTAENLNATSQFHGSMATAIEDQQKNQELAQRYGGKLVTNDNNTICLLFDVPAKYLTKIVRKSFHQIPVTINFFRTTKEVNQLIRTDWDANKWYLTSLWTENIGVFYEMAAEIASDIIWSNCIGLFDRNMPLLNSNLAIDNNAITSTSKNRCELNWFLFSKCIDL